MKDALPLIAPADDNDEVPHEVQEPMKGGLPTTATDTSGDETAWLGGEEPKD